MGYLYSELVDRAKIQTIIGTNFQNAAKTVSSGLVQFDGDIMQGTTSEWIREKLFQGDSDGQTIGVNSEITLKGKSQTLYNMPVVWRGDGALLDDIFEDISVKEATKMAEANVQKGIMDKGAQMVDGVFVAIINGVVAYLASSGYNYLDKNGSQITPKILQQAKSKRGDAGEFVNGLLVCRSLMYYQLGALGMAAYTAQTLGAAAQDSLTRTGKVINDSYLGMTVVMTDKLYNQAGAASDTGSDDHYIVLCERGALIAKNGGAPMIDPITRRERSYQDVVKFRIKAGGTIQGVDWAGSVGASGEITNTVLSTSTSWTAATGSGLEKFIPMAVVRVDQPSFA